MADHYRHPVIVCCDGLIGQMMEPVEFDHPVEIKSKADPADWALGAQDPAKETSSTVFLMTLLTAKEEISETLKENTLKWLQQKQDMKNT